MNTKTISETLNKDEGMKINLWIIMLIISIINVSVIINIVTTIGAMLSIFVAINNINANWEKWVSAWNKRINNFIQKWNNQKRK